MRTAREEEGSQPRGVGERGRERPCGACPRTRGGAESVLVTEVQTVLGACPRTRGGAGSVLVPSREPVRELA